MAEKDVVDIRVESEDGSVSNAEEHFGASLINPRYSTWSDHSRNSYRNSYRDSVQKPARTRLVKQWSQRSLSDLHAESPPGTPGPGTPMSTLLCPSTTWLPSESGTSTPMPTPLVGGFKGLGSLSADNTHREAKNPYGHFFQTHLRHTSRKTESKVAR